MMSKIVEQDTSSGDILYTSSMVWLYGSAIFLSSSLLFFIQPMCAKMLLPGLGCAPAVWTTCMVFFQAALLGGYAYADVSTRTLSAKRQALLQIMLLGLACLFLPVVMPIDVAVPTSVPVLWLLEALLMAVGLPFFVVAACGPLIQRWYRLASYGNDPYFLFSLSNLGSFTALVLYPLAVEPFLTLREQADYWRFGYVVLALVCLILALYPGKRSVGAASGAVLPPTAPAKVDSRPPGNEKLRWVMLALAPSSLMLSVTTYLTTDIASIPLLWVIPLSLYLLTFTLVFSRRQIVSRHLLVRWMPLVVLVLGLMILLEGTEPLVLVLALHLLGLFWLAMVCHGELAQPASG